MRVKVTRASSIAGPPVRYQDVETLADLLAIGREVDPHTVTQTHRSVVVTEELATGDVEVMQYDDYIE